MSKINVVFLSAIILLLFSCASENKQNDNDVKTEEIEITDDKVENSIKLPSENFIELLDIENHQTIIDKDKNSNFTSSIDSFLINKLQLKEVFEKEIEIYSVSIPNIKSQYYHTIIVGLENTCCFYNTYLLTYSLEGKFIDKLLITEGDYIESISHLESIISKDTISRIMYKANLDVEPSVDEVWKEDTFSIDDNGKFQGNNLIFGSDKVLAEEPVVKLNASEIFIGKWKKEDANNPISPTEFLIEERNDKSKYTVVLMNNIVRVFGGEINSTIITGESMFGNTELKIISENPPIISYSDKGYAEGMEPMEGKKNVRFVKVKSYKNLLMGKWQSTDDKNNFVEFTEDLRIETNGDNKDTEQYSLSNTCKNGAGIKSNEDEYISGWMSGLCWSIISVDDKNLSLSYMGRGNTLNYIRVK